MVVSVAEVEDVLPSAVVEAAAVVFVSTPVVVAVALPILLIMLAMVGMASETVISLTVSIVRFLLSMRTSELTKGNERERGEVYMNSVKTFTSLLSV